MASRSLGTRFWRLFVSRSGSNLRVVLVGGLGVGVLLDRGAGWRDLAAHPARGARPDAGDRGHRRHGCDGRIPTVFLVSGALQVLAAAASWAVLRRHRAEIAASFVDAAPSSAAVPS